MSIILLLLVMPVAAFGQAPEKTGKPPAQAIRGQVIFLNVEASGHCGGCHALDSKGASIAPDLSRLARLPARAIATAIRSTRTQYVLQVKVKGAAAFPGMPGAKSETGLTFYDLSATPPALRKVAPKEVEGIHDNAAWTHPPALAGYTAQQLADVIAYIKWAAYRDTKVVEADEIE